MKELNEDDAEVEEGFMLETKTVHGVELQLLVCGIDFEIWFLRWNVEFWVLQSEAGTLLDKSMTKTTEDSKFTKEQIEDGQDFFLFDRQLEVIMQKQF